MSFNGDLYPEAGADVVMDTKGDIVRFDSVREKYGIGSTNQVLSVTAGLPAWKTLTTADSVLTTQGDVLVEGASGLERLGFGTSGYFLTTNGTGANPTWTAGATGDMLLGTSQAITASKTFVDDVKCYFGTSDVMSIWLASGGAGYIKNTAGTIQFQSDVGAFGATCFAYNESNKTLDSSGEFTGDKNCHRVSTYLSAGTDDCIVADYTATGKAGSLFVLIAYNNNDVTLKDSGGTSPEFLMNGDFTLDNIADTCTFIQFPNLTNNYELSRSNNV